MPINYEQLPPITRDPAHYAVVSTLSRLRQTELEGFLARRTGSHAAAIFLREVLYWLSPSRKAPERPRATVYRNGHYWVARTQERWFKDNGMTRTKLETVYRRCADFIEIDHFMFASQRQTHYRIKFDKLREAMERDETLQACLKFDRLRQVGDRDENLEACRQSDLSAAKSRASMHSVHAFGETLDAVETAPERREVKNFKKA
jgi:hypothetical protein